MNLRSMLPLPFPLQYAIVSAGVMVAPASSSGMVGVIGRLYAELPINQSYYNLSYN